MLAPAAGGLIVQFLSWRMIFGIIAILAAIVAVVVLIFLPETLLPSKRSPIDFRAAAQVLFGATVNIRFMSYTLVFGLMGSIQLIFGVVAPFFYQQGLGFAPAVYGMIALGFGAANLLGEVSCGTLATRITPRQLCFGSWFVFAIGALILALSGTFLGLGFLTITLGGALTLFGCGTLCPTMYGMALGLFSRNLGLIGGYASAVCYLMVSLSMLVAARLPDNSQGPLGWLYIVLGLGGAVLLAVSLPRGGRDIPLKEVRYSS